MIAVGVAVGRVELEAGAVDGDVELFDLGGDAFDVSCGNGSLVIVTAAVCGSTLILERTLTSPRLNGPATAGVTTRIPNGAPS